MRDKFVLAILAVFVQAVFAQEISPIAAEPVAPGSAPPVVEIAPPPAPEPAPAAPVAPEPAPAPVVIPPPYAAPEPEPTPAAAPAPAVQEISIAYSSESSSDISFNLGVRAGAGISQFRKHIALIPNHEFYKGIKLNPSLSASAGLAFQIGINELFAIAPELQYSFYSAENDLQVKDANERYNARLYEAGVYLHVFEIPLLARFNLSPVYLEVGPQLGFNLYSRIYEDLEFYRPDLGLVAFSAVGGVGAKVSNTLVGVRGGVGFLKYAKDAKGIPWNVQVGVTQFVF
jgi:hypothetical protein